ASDVAVQEDRRVADTHLRAEPLVLLVGRHPVDLEEHPETPAVYRFVGARLLTEPLERPARNERDRSSAVAPVDRVVLGPEERERPADELRDRVFPRAEHPPRRMRMSVHLGIDRSTEFNGPFDALSIAEREGENTRVFVPFRPDA